MYKEKYYIIFQPDGATLDQRSELYSIYIYVVIHIHKMVWICFKFVYFRCISRREGYKKNKTMKF